MTLTDSTNRVQYTGDGSTTSFAITFVFWDADDPQVTHADSSGTETTWTRGTQYTITGGSGATGTLTVVTSPTDYTPALNETLTIKSNLANTQPTSLPAGGELPSGTLEQQLDQIVRQLQQFSETVGRSITLKISSTENDVTIEDLDGNTGKFAQVNAAEDGFTYASVTSSGTITDPVPVANGGTGSTSAATAITALGAAGTGVSNTFTKNQVWNKGSDLSSASPLVLGTTGNYFDVTGTTGFSQITCTSGTLFMLQFDGALTMTDGSNLDLAGANIVTVAGGRGLFFAVATNKAQLLAYQVEGSPPLTYATQAQMETATATNVSVSPGRVQNHPGAVKAWVNFVASSGSINASHGTSSITDQAAGDHTMNLSTAMSSASYAVVIMSHDSDLTGDGDWAYCLENADRTKTTTACHAAVYNADTNPNKVDTQNVSMLCLGDQ
jgi:hypothetical protein